VGEAKIAERAHSGVHCRTIPTKVTPSWPWRSLEILSGAKTTKNPLSASASPAAWCLFVRFLLAWEFELERALIIAYCVCYYLHPKRAIQTVGASCVSNYPDDWTNLIVKCMCAATLFLTEISDAEFICGESIARFCFINVAKGLQQFTGKSSGLFICNSFIHSPTCRCSVAAGTPTRVRP
jgi:hypothetical protein